MKKDYENYYNLVNKICEENNINIFRGDLGVVIYPDGYGEIQSKKYFLEILKLKKVGDKTATLKCKDSTEVELKNFLIEFKNGVINNKFCLNNVVDYSKDEDDFIYIESEE